MHQSYEQAYTKSSNDNTSKIKQNNNKKSISIAIETATCLALHHISTKNGKNKNNKKHNLRSTICMHCTGMSCSLDHMFVCYCVHICNGYFQRQYPSILPPPFLFYISRSDPKHSCVKEGFPNSNNFGRVACLEEGHSQNMVIVPGRPRLTAEGTLIDKLNILI